MKSTIAILVLGTIGMHTSNLLLSFALCVVCLIIILKSNKNE